MSLTNPCVTHLGFKFVNIENVDKTPGRYKPIRRRGDICTAMVRRIFSMFPSSADFISLRSALVFLLTSQ